MVFWNTKKNPEEELRGYKKITVNKMRFTIKRINPLIDFPSDKIPQIFTDFQSRRKPVSPDVSVDKIKSAQHDMYSILEAGIVEPEMFPIGKAGGLNAEDLFRDPSMGVKLYHEILNHSLNQFKGINSLFFWIGTRLSLLTLYANGTVNGLRISSSPKKTSQ